MTVGEEPEPLYEILDRVRASFDLDFLEVLADGASKLTLTQDEMFDRKEPATLAQTEASTTFVFDGRTVRAERITLRLGREAGLQVSATATPSRVDVGEVVTFEATVTGVTDGAAEVNWTFGDGSPRASGERVTHRFEKAETYNVLAGVTAAGDSGDTAIVSVTVGEPPDPTPSPSATATASAAPGVVGGGSTPSTGGTTSPPPGTTAVPAKTPKATPTATAMATPTPTPYGELVEGRLLDAPAAAAGALAAAAPAAEASDDRDDDGSGGGLSVPPEAVAGVLLALLAGAGFAVDMRRSRARWA